MIKPILLIVLCGLTISINAQKEWSNWYYNGQTLLTFKHGYAEIVHNFINPVPADTDWFNYYNWGSGGISYSDPVTGDMKFIVANRTVFSSDYKDIRTDSFLRSCPDKYSYHVLPFHTDSNKFYIVQFQSIYADLIQQESLGLQVRCPNAIGLGYSMFDLSLNNNKGNYYNLDNVIETRLTEQMTTVKHANGKDVWVIVHPYNSNQFSAVLFTDDGVQSPINSSAGPYIGSGSNSVLGKLTASHDGKLLAGYSNTNTAAIQLFHFDNATGMVSDFLTLSAKENVGELQFSPDNSKLYYLGWDGLYQYDLNQTDIAASLTKIYGQNNGLFYDLQLAPDGKIYVTKTYFFENGDYKEYVGAVECPNLPQYACNFNPKVFDVFPPVYFPDLINDFIQQPKAPSTTKFSLGNDTSICFGSYKIKAPDGWESYRWNTGETTQEITVSKAGLYYVLTGNTGFSCPSAYGYINVTDKAKKLNLGADTTLCAGTPYPLHINDDYSNIRWQNGSHARDSVITNNSLYIISANDVNGCYTSDSIGIYYKYYPQASFGSDTTLCNNQPLTLQLYPEKSPFYSASYLWQDSSTNDKYTVTQPGTYWGRVMYDGCTVADTIAVNYITADRVYLGADTTLCAGDSLYIHANINGATYLWNTGETKQGIFVNKAGIYSVLVGNGSCTVTDTIQVNFTAKPNFSLGKDTALCDGQTLVLNSSGEEGTYLWRDGSTSGNYKVFQQGLYWLTLTQNGCSATDSIYISYKKLPSVLLGKDTAFCKGSSLILNAYNTAIASYHWQDGTTNAQYKTSAAGTYSVHVTDVDGCVNSDTITVSEIKVPTFSLGNDTILCDHATLTYNFSLGNVQYLWNDGNRNNHYSITSPGLYWLAITDNGCSASDTMSVIYHPNPKVNLGADTVLCEGKTIFLNANYNGATYRWQDGSTAPFYEVIKDGKYKVDVALDDCTVSDSILISYKSSPVFSLGNDTLLCIGQQMILHPLLQNPITFHWQDGSTQPQYTVTQAGVYSLQASNDCGTSFDEIRITTASCRLELPASFTPNSDGINDVFRLKYPQAIKQYHMVIFNRFGKKIFESTDPYKGWDGTCKSVPQDTGTYICILHFTDIDNHVQNSQSTVVLLR